MARGASEAATSGPTTSTLTVVNAADLLAQSAVQPSSTSGYGDAYCATEPGTGADNPTHPQTLTDLERSRALMYSFEATDHFDVALLIQRTGTWHILHA